VRFPDPRQLEALRAMMTKIKPKEKLNKPIKRAPDKNLTCQICVEETKNLSPDQIIRHVPGRIIEVN
jgi:hypothetical protein